MNHAPRPYHHGNLREALLEAAEQALEAGGAKSLSLRKLSRALDVSHTSPRRHFVDKQALLDALAVRGFKRFGEAAALAAAERGEGFDQSLIRLARMHVGFALQHPALFGWMFEAKQRADATPELRAAGEQALFHVSAIFIAGQQSGAVIPGDPARLSFVAFAAVQGLISISTDGKFKEIPLDALVGEIIERLILGLRPRA